MLSIYSAPFDVKTLPFVNVATLLAKMPVPIPEVVGHAGDLGMLALQDLGDVTLQAHLGAVSPEEIAVSIVAELVALRHGRSAPHLRALSDARFERALSEA